MANSNILICDPTGISTAAGILSSYFIIRKLYRLEDIMKVMTDVKPNACMSLSLRRGLDQLQRSIDEKKLKRLNDKVRTSEILSIGF